MSNQETALPDPMTPADCDLRGMEWMPLYGGRLFGSDFDAHASDAEFRAAVQLWWAAWNQVPAASLPDDDIALCRLAGFGRDVKAWRKVKERALHGFTKCSDGRLYHKALVGFANESWQRRLKDRERKARFRADKERREAADGTRTETGTGRGRDADKGVDGTADEMRRDAMRCDETLSKSSEANASAAAAPPVDLTKLAFDAGVAVLTASGKSESSARGLVGKWRKQFGDEAVFAVLGECQRQSVTDPPSWMEAALKARAEPRRKPWEKPEPGLPTSHNDTGQWRARVLGWTPGRFWNRGDWGPEPGEPGCRVPAPVLAEWQAGQGGNA